MVHQTSQIVELIFLSKPEKMIVETNRVKSWLTLKNWMKIKIFLKFENWIAEKR